MAEEKLKTELVNTLDNLDEDSLLTRDQLKENVEKLTPEAVEKISNVLQQSEGMPKNKEK
ncbi:MAG: hypothetical protein JWL87_446 [Candidatus Adlerbacteria bacterium]|nr:hypothetical protein [Candidatus Adlerbacteria bacterium]